MSEKLNAILITGMPGVGKTTLIKKISNELLKLSVQISGFYTEEVRNPLNNQRIGFDVITLNDNKRSVLARIENDKDYHGKTARIGKYIVQIDSFESACLPLLTTKRNYDLLIIDEIGKMELLSKTFEQNIKEIIKQVTMNQIKLIITIPCKHDLRIINDIKALKNAKLYEVTKENRNQLFLDIKENIIKCLLQK